MLLRFQGIHPPYGFEKLVHLFGFKKFLCLFGILDQNFICYQSSERCRENANFNVTGNGNIEADNLLYGNDPF